MKKLFLLFFLVIGGFAAQAQFEQPDRMLSTPKYLPLDDEVGSAPELNVLLNSYIPEYTITKIDTSNRDRGGDRRGHGQRRENNENTVNQEQPQQNNTGYGTGSESGMPDPDLSL